ncbi:hypothetical protein BN2475_640001 [Paraburkholderia ribeironis]|uniref:Uncharacterized protein n=1 Tax=Paraburkholderia ribeironis TaxID=1247936 RepID=A0A1N7SGX7_9BURK|nr:hypothetical protein BN2475_640001 [Paraburkholderia ribeironis]
MKALPAKEFSAVAVTGNDASRGLYIFAQEIRDNSSQCHKVFRGINCGGIVVLAKQ